MTPVQYSNKPYTQPYQTVPRYPRNQTIPPFVPHPMHPVQHPQKHNKNQYVPYVTPTYVQPILPFVHSHDHRHDEVPPHTHEKTSRHAAGFEPYNQRPVVNYITVYNYNTYNIYNGDRGSTNGQNMTNTTDTNINREELPRLLF